MDCRRATRGHASGGCTGALAMSRIIALLCATLFALLAAPALAHKPSDAYLSLTRDEAALSGQWDIALRDLDNAIGLDSNGDGDLTWGEIRSKRAEVVAYAMSRLAVASAGAPCTLSVTDQ